METITVYIGHDNTTDLVLVSMATSGAVTYVEADSFDRYTIDLGDIVLDSDDTGFVTGGLFDTVSVVVGENTVTALRLRLGLADTITAGSYKARLVGYNDANPEGLVWYNKMPLKFLA